MSDSNTHEVVTADELAALLQSYDRDFEQPWVGDRNGAEACCDRGLLRATTVKGYQGIESIAYALTREGADLVRMHLRNHTDQG